jgi:hypothetical protein
LSSPHARFCLFKAEKAGASSIHWFNRARHWHRKASERINHLQIGHLVKTIAGQLGRPIF